MVRSHSNVARHFNAAQIRYLGFRSPHRAAIKHRFDGPPLIGPEKRRKKAIRTKNCLSDSEFFSFRFFLSIAGSGQSSGSPSFGYFSWRSKKSDCPAARAGRGIRTTSFEEPPHPNPLPQGERGKRLLQPCRRPQHRCLIRRFPRELRLITSEVPVCRRFFVDRAHQVQHVDDALRTQVEMFVN